MSTLPLSGQVAVVVGGGGGIGKAAAGRLARLGARVALLDRADDAELKRLADDLPGAGHGGVFAQIDDSETLVAAASAVQARWGRADILVNAAGFTKPIPHKDLDALTDELIDQMFAVNWRGQFAAIRAFAPLLRQNGQGLVVNISSIAATTGVGSNVAYCALKAGIDVMASCLGRALAPDIRVMNVSPGVVDTTFVPGRDQAWNDKQAVTTPLRRIGSTEDIAAAIEACATTLKFSTGTVLQVDGGRHLGTP
ncbi:SDR family NAD(P)-dependent oxidoreductase [Polaromonas sp. JS666]|uniref:SDR family NAD(P)-dependent oxidoreductase n=1 Tax=Polaromonas sp. (strain JS666 / ATCC BAA-500) TaxID=296591 RepID=UPI00059B7636|nr:SDR family oxidoreductase [Polaromonas sp. JS666]